MVCIHKYSVCMHIASTLTHTVQLSPGDSPAVQLCLHEGEKETHPTIITGITLHHVHEVLYSIYNIIYNHIIIVCSSIWLP